MTLLRDVNATLDAETSKVIGTVNIAEGQEVAVPGVATDATLAGMSAKIPPLAGVLTGNSSTTPLNSGGAFTGAAVDVSGFPSVTVAVLTDRDGSCFAQFSTDGTNWDSSIPSSVTAGVNEVHRYTVTRKYFRVVLQNGVVGNQSYLRLQCMSGAYPSLTSALNSTIQQDADAQVTREIDFNFSTAQGLYQGLNNTIKVGIVTCGTAASVTLSAPQDVATQGGVYSGFPASPVASEIVVAGADTGTVFYSYMATDTDTDYTFASKAIAGNATYSLGHDIWRCNFAYFVSSSSTGFNVGNITVQGVGGANVFCRIDAGYSESYCSAYTVPYNSSVYFDQIRGGMRGNASGQLDGFFWYREYGASPRLRFPFELQYGGIYFDDIDYLTKIPSRTDIMPRIVAASANSLTGKMNFRFVKAKS